MTDKDALETYITAIDKGWRTGHATEHTYRGALADLFNTLRPKLQTINEPKHIECGAPDFIILEKGLPLAFVEAKDIGDGDLDGRKLKGGNKEQFDRYKSSLAHIAFTDYLDFHFYEKGEFVASVRIGDIRKEHVVLLAENVAAFVARVDDLFSGSVQPIKSARQLAGMMAAKARLLEQIAYKLLMQKRDRPTGIQKLMSVFKTALIPDIDARAFADVYAQTLTYGLFAARLHDETPETFSRHEAMSLIPKSNPFLSQLFVYIGTQLEPELEWIVDDLVTMFGASDIRAILKDYGKAEAKGDPMIHFYEDFLSSYDSGLRRARGVWYTPLPVVKFIVGAVDTILEKTFGLQDGLANKDKIDVTVVRDTTHGRKGTETATEKFHKVQVLDPATGTGTFLAECVNRIHGKFVNNQGRWQDYVSKDLLPRLNGFEILMASYTMAHVKLDCVLANTGYVHQGNQRFNVFLTNSLEEYVQTNGQLFAFALGEEANAANRVKRDAPVMVIMGNPPYSVSSVNSGRWIRNELCEYTKNLDDRNLQPLSDDYIKFVRFGQYYIEKNGAGVLAYICPHGFLDGMIHRQMRKSLLETFDEIYILNLHGNSRRKESAPDGSKDDNVFAIQQGVSINIFVKRDKRASDREWCAVQAESELASVHYADLYGHRKAKYDFLNKNTIETVKWKVLDPKQPYYFFVPKDFSCQLEYDKGFKITELMPDWSSGIQTGRDTLFIGLSDNEISMRLKRLLSNDYGDDFAHQYKISDSSGYNLMQRISESKFDRTKVRKSMYRPFDFRSIYYDTRLVKRAFANIMCQMIHRNTSLILCKQATNDWRHVYVSELVSDMNSISAQSREASYVFPLYLYHENMGQVERVPNFDKEIYEKICDAVGGDATTRVPPEEVFDYIYAVLHTPEYREKYKEFLKVDFPRIPYPKDAVTFRKLVAYGEELRRAHLLKNKHSQSEPTAAFPVAGENVVESVRWENDRVYINSTQYFDKVPQSAYDFWIGGYQPAQKWLKDRREKILTNEDCEHYQSIILALLETQEVMAELSTLSKEWL